MSQDPRIVHVHAAMARRMMSLDPGQKEQVRVVFTSMAEGLRRFERVTRQAADALRPVLAIASLRLRGVCPWCLRPFAGQWQLRKHERTAHGVHR